MSRKDKKKNINGKGPNALWLLIAGLVVGMTYLFWYNSNHRDVIGLSYSTLLKQLDENKVSTIAIQDQHVQGKLKDGRFFDTHVLLSDKFIDLLTAKNIDVEVYPKEKAQWGSYFLFMIFLLSLLPLFLYYRQTQGGGAGKMFNVGKSKARFFSPNSISVTFKDVAGVVEAKEDLKDIIEYLKNPERFEKIGAKIPRGVLLSGDPGNGKTLLAKAVAGEANCPFFSISGSDFVEVFVGVGASRVRDLFTQARRHAPCIVFIDEIDAVGRQRGVGLGGGNDEREQTLNQLLSEMDGFSTEHGSVIVLAATNRQDVLDKALLRPGRFDRVVEVPYPDLAARREILDVHVRNVKLSSDVNLDRVAQGTSGFSGANLGWLINEAALNASRENATMISMEHLERSRDKILVGAERKNLIFTEKERLATAYHEAGHSLLNVLLPDATPFHKVTVLARGPALGLSWSIPERDTHTYSRAHIEAQIMVALGGLLAEKLIFGQHGSGVSSDLKNATAQARNMVVHFGMSELGPVSFAADRYGEKHYSESTHQAIDTEVSRIMHDCLTRAEALLLTHKDKLEKLALELNEKETLHAAQVYELLGIPPRDSYSFTSEKEILSAEETVENTNEEDRL